jgi:hypothetical protein
MTIPFLIETPGWVQYFPLAALLVRRNLSRPVLWVAAGAFVSVFGNFLGRIAAARVGNNHWVGAIDMPAMFACYLAAIEEWQVTYLERLTVRISLFLALAFYVVLVAFVEDVSTFSEFATPMLTLALFAGGAWTLLRRGLRTVSQPLWTTDWCWIVGGLTIYGATTLLTQPIGGALLAAQRMDLFTRVWELRAVCVDVAFLTITAGFFLRPALLDPPQ